MLEMGEFAKFIREFIDLYNEEQQDKYLWDLFVHSPLYEGDFEKFKRERIKPKVKEPTVSELKATIEKSKEILDIFKSSQGGE